MTYSYEEFLKQLGKRLRAMRLERGWSLRDMIVDQGYHLIQWQNLEKGKGLSVPSLLRLCNVFDVKLTVLLDGLGEQGSAPTPSAATGDRVPTRKSARVTSTKRPKTV